MTRENDQLPDGLEYVRTTDTFDEVHHPAGLRRAHRVAEGVWAQLLVHTGDLHFIFEDDPDKTLQVSAGESIIIPPLRLHHVDIAAPVTFALKFYRDPHRASAPGKGSESTGLVDN